MTKESSLTISAGNASAFVVETRSNSSVKREPFNSPEEAQKVLILRRYADAAKGFATTVVFASSLAAGVSVFADNHLWSNVNYVGEHQAVKDTLGIGLITIGTQSRVVFDNTIRRISLLSKQLKATKENI